MIAMHAKGSYQASASGDSEPGAMSGQRAGCAQPSKWSGTHTESTLASSATATIMRYDSNGCIGATSKPTFMRIGDLANRLSIRLFRLAASPRVPQRGALTRNRIRWGLFWAAEAREPAFDLFQDLEWFDRNVHLDTGLESCPVQSIVNRLQRNRIG